LPPTWSSAILPATAALEPSLNGMIEWLKTNPDQSPKMVAGVVGDRSEIGESVAGYNELLGQVTRGIYAANVL